MHDGEGKLHALAEVVVAIGPEEPPHERSTLQSTLNLKKRDCSMAFWRGLICELNQLTIEED